jgi:hypothetical protein
VIAAGQSMDSPDFGRRELFSAEATGHYLPSIGRFARRNWAFKSRLVRRVACSWLSSGPSPTHPRHSRSRAVRAQRERETSRCRMCGHPLTCPQCSKRCRALRQRAPLLHQPAMPTSRPPPITHAPMQAHTCAHTQTHTHMHTQHTQHNTHAHAHTAYTHNTHRPPCNHPHIFGCM